RLYIQQSAELIERSSAKTDACPGCAATDVDIAFVIVVGSVENIRPIETDGARRTDTGNVNGATIGIVYQICAGAEQSQIGCACAIIQSDHTTDFVCLHYAIVRQVI